MGGGAWPILVGGVTRLVNFDNERDPSYLFTKFHANGVIVPKWTINVRLKEVSGEIRSVMPLDTLGSTRATMGTLERYIHEIVCGAGNDTQERDSLLQLSDLN